MTRTASDGIAAVLITAIGAATGWLLVGGVVPIAAGAFVGAAVGLAVPALHIRPVVAVAVAAGTAIGALLGAGVVHVLCLPGACETLEVAGGVVTGVGAFFGVGLVVALATRSFDEYSAAVQEGRPPPTPGCETDEVQPR